MAGEIIIKNDREINIAIGKSRKAKRLKNNKFKWSALVNLLSNTVYTKETVEEYRKLSKEEQDNIKDVGGFVGGELLDGIRRKDCVINRSIITLDADYGTDDMLDKIQMLFDFSFVLYSTHKHSKSNKRFRLIIPLNRDVTGDEYEDISRKIAYYIGINYFDSTTFQSSRLMYFPSTSRDGEFEFYYKDGEFIDTNKILNSHTDYMDLEELSQYSNENEEILKCKDRKKSPKDKGGLIGAFCRAYSIQEAIETFLNDIYTKTKDENRYTYKNGSTTGGLVIYDNGEFAFSNHETDIASGRLCNSFDLVRLHKFSSLDSNSHQSTKDSKLPSYKAMLEFAKEDKKVKIILGKDRLKVAMEEFSEGSSDNNYNDFYKDENCDNWLASLEVDKFGNYKVTINNILIILENDPYLKEKIALNEFSNRTVIRESLPWHKVIDKKKGDIWNDSDDAALRNYIEKVYKINSQNKISDAFLIMERNNSYHPIREYIKSLKWDGTKRLENLFIDYLGAENSEYVKTVTRKAFVAAVNRVFEPGVKFDYMLVLIGKQGIGKSHIINLLGQNWYSDSLTTVQGREAYEQLQDAWLIEMAELSAMKRAEVEAIKHFISKREDIYRVAYGRRVSKFPRQCIFIGTTNDIEFLKDRTGNRRFWPVVLHGNNYSKNLWKDMNKYEIDQIWAEAFKFYEEGEKLFLDGAIKEEALKRQANHIVENSKERLIREYLDILLPESWSDFTIEERRSFINGVDGNEFIEGTVSRQKVCAMEIWAELFNEEINKLTPMNAREINDIIRKTMGWKEYSGGSGKLRFGNVYGYQRAFLREESDVY